MSSKSWLNHGSLSLLSLNAENFVAEKYGRGNILISIPSNECKTDWSNPYSNHLFAGDHPTGWVDITSTFTSSNLNRQTTSSYEDCLNPFWFRTSLKLSNSVIVAIWKVVSTSFVGLKY